jgi:hypothetical protein
MSTFAAVGSGARYDFTESDITTLEKRFEAWRGAGKPKPVGTKKIRSTKKDKDEARREREAAEWAEEGPVVLADIRDPRVRAEVKRRAQADEDRLVMLLLSKNMHITQLGDRKTA